MRHCTEIPATEKPLWMKNLTIAMAHGDDLAKQCVLLSAMSVADSDECDRLYSFSLRGKISVKSWLQGMYGDSSVCLTRM